MLVKFVYIRNSSAESWRSSLKRIKKPIWRNLLKAKFTLARTVFQSPETLSAHHQDLLKSCFRSRFQTCLQCLGQARAGGGNLWQLAVVTGPAPAQPHWQGPPHVADRTCPAAHPTQSSFSLLRTGQPCSILQTSSTKPCSVPLQLAAPALFLDLFQSPQPASVFSPPCLSVLPITILSSCAMPEITSLLPAPGASSSTLICPERLQPVPGTLPTGRFPKQAHLSLPNANLLIQLLAPLRFFLYLSFSRAPLPPLLHISKPLPSP